MAISPHQTEGARPEPIYAYPLLCLLLLGTTLIYFPGIHGPFLLDDFGTIINNPPVHLNHFTFEALANAAVSSDAGPLRRPLAMATFAIDHLISGLTPAGYKVTNIAIHLAITLLLFLVSRQLLQRQVALKHAGRVSSGHPLPSASWGALLIASLWALHPLNVSTVLYVVQRMTQMAMLFTMLGIWVYLRYRARLLADSWPCDMLKGGLGVALCFLAAILSKENGALLPLLLLITEAVFFRFAVPAGRENTRWVLVAMLVAPSLALVALPVYVGFAGSSAMPSFHDFTPGERLLTEARILFGYLANLLWPDIRGMSFYYDTVKISRSLLDPPATFPAIAGWGLLVVAAGWCWGRNIARGFVFGTFLFIGGHLLESTTLPLESGFEHRNYLPAFGIAFMVGAAMTALMQSRQITPRLARILALGLLAGVAVPLHDRVTMWATPANFFNHTLQHHPGSARAWGDFSFFLILHGRTDEALPPLLKAAELNPREAGYLISAINLLMSQRQVPENSVVQQAMNRIEGFPLSAYGQNSLITFIRQLTEEPATPASLEIAARILNAAATNAALRPQVKRLTGLALVYVEKKRGLAPP